MRLLTGLTLGTILGITGTILTRRYGPPLLWHVLTADTREKR